MSLSDAQAEALYGLTRAQIEALAERVYRDVVARIRAGETPRDAIDAALGSFSGPYYALMSDALSRVLQRAVGTAEVKQWPIGEVVLSDKLYHAAAQTSAAARQVIKDHAAYFHDVRKLALELFEGYGFREDEPLKPKVKLPKYMRDAALEGELERLLARIQAATLKTGPLRAGYLEALDAIERGAGQEALDKALRRAVYERHRYFANRVAQTELHRAHTDQIARETMADDGVEIVEYRLSKSHPEPDICDLFAGQDRYGLGPGIYPKAAVPKPPVHPFCLTGDALITAAGRITAASKRWFDGDAAVITTASGKRLTATVNHPVLTPRGWVGAGLLDVGDEVVSRVEGVAVSGSLLGDDEHQHMPSRIAEIADAFFAARQVATREVPVSAEDFHGDGIAGQVAVVGADRKLWDRVDAERAQIARYQLLERADAAAACLFGERVLHLGRKALRRPADGVMRRLRKRRALVFAELGQPDHLLFAGASRLDSGPLQHAVDCQSADSVTLRQRKHGRALLVRGYRVVGKVARDMARSLHGVLDRLNANLTHPLLDHVGGDADLAANLCQGESGPVLFDAVVQIDRLAWCGHVYNLETEQSHYTANGIITHNCRCLLRPRVDLTGAKPGRERQRADAAYLRSLDADTARKVAGSAAKRDAILSGTPVRDVLDAGRPAVYRLRTLGEAIINDRASAYVLAQHPGKPHHGWLQKQRSLPTVKLRKSVRSLQKQIERHEAWIADPYLKFEPDAAAEEVRYHQVVKWPRDIARQREQIDILEGVVNERKE